MAKSKNAGKGSVAQVQDKDERRKALDAAMAQIEKQFGQGAVMRLGDKSQVEIDTIPTGALTLDIALGIGGLPRGRIIEIYGPESSGKTTVALHCVAEAQKMGGTCAFIDAEHALDPVYAGNIGVDVDNLLLSQPDTGEQALDSSYRLRCSTRSESRDRRRDGRFPRWSSGTSHEPGIKKACTCRIQVKYYLYLYQPAP